MILDFGGFKDYVTEAGWLINGEEKLVRKIANPSFRITFEGGEADKLLKILPPPQDVIAGQMNKAERKKYLESFGNLLIYSNKSNAASGKSISISCASAELNYDESKQKHSLKQLPKTYCTISISGPDENGNNPEVEYGDVSSFDPKTELAPKVCK